MSTQKDMLDAIEAHRETGERLKAAYENHFPKGTRVRWQHGNHWRYGFVRDWHSWRGAENFELTIESDNGARFRKSPCSVRKCP